MWTRKIAAIVAMIALCAAAAGCVSDTATPTAADRNGDQLRYYGGPKYPMWQAQ